ncbi:uncharacterized protein LOC121835262 [Ixodes scapularis]|uniref:uncharacterized protein LOC121835262 n=1 Tax=Ixodes scapularis TaxID=6945 RepID=UPI001C38E603|nr:uncharacterized protein LOC121835262 [Ixodes scapularis]
MGAIRRRQDSRIEVIYWLGTLRSISKMAALVHTLDRRRTALGIAVMSVTSTTLEDVYLKMVGIPDFKGAGQEFKTSPTLAEYEASMEQQGRSKDTLKKLRWILMQLASEDHCRASTVFRREELI